MKWVLIDLSFLAHRAKNISLDLSYEELPTGILYGFFEQLKTICFHPQIKSNKIMIFADSRKSYRRKTFPAYKQKRRDNKTPEEIEENKIMYAQIDLLCKEILPSIGIKIHKQVGLESDDLIAITAKFLHRKQKDSVIVTSDGDLYQCITEHVHWFDPQRNKYLTRGDFIKLKNIPPESWAKVKAIGGCNSDEVPGIKGVSEKGAIDYIQGNIPEHHQRYKKIIESIKNKEIIKWLELVELPHTKTKRIRPEKPNYNINAFFEFCKDYGMDSFLEKSSAWKKLFNGRFETTLKIRSRNGKRKRLRI